MKMIFFIVLLSLSGLNATAQSEKPIEMKLKNGVSYLIFYRNPGSSIIRNSNNKLFKIDIHKDIDRSGYESAEPMGYVTHTKESIAKFYELLDEAFEKDGRPILNQKILGRFYFDKYGNILEIEFLGKDVDEKFIDSINLIESTMIGHFTFNTVPEKLKEGEVYSLSYVIEMQPSK